MIYGLSKKTINSPLVGIKVRNVLTTSELNLSWSFFPDLIKFNDWDDFLQAELIHISSIQLLPDSRINK